MTMGSPAIAVQTVGSGLRIRRRHTVQDGVRTEKKVVGEGQSSQSIKTMHELVEVALAKPKRSVANEV